MIPRRSRRALGVTAAGGVLTAGAAVLVSRTSANPPAAASSVPLASNVSGAGLNVPAVIAQRQRRLRRQPNVLLVTIDTLRTDHVGLGIPGGSATAITPVLDRLAAEGAAGAAHVQLPQTLPNHASILTGTYIQTHGLRTTLWDQSRDAVPTLDQIFRSAGYRTAGIVSWFSLDHEFTNLVRAYEHWEQVVTRFGSVVAGAPERVTPEETRAAFRAGIDMSKAFDGDAKLTSDAAITWLNSHGTLTDKPWFFWLHYRDPHYPFTPPRESTSLPAGGASFDGGHTNLGRITGGYVPTPAEMASLRTMYAGEITYTDAQLGRVLNRLEALKLAEDTIVVVTADHGESFLEHGPWDWLHGHSVYEAATRVPLYLRFSAEPTTIRPATRIEDRIQSADIAPTLLTLAGVAVPDTMEAASFSPLLAGAGSSGQPARTAWGTIFDDSQSYVVDGEWKLIRWNSPGVRTVHELYHLASDPRETYDYAREHPAIAARLAASLQSWHETLDSGKRWQYSRSA